MSENTSSDRLLSKLRQTPSSKVAQKVKETEGLSKADADKKKRQLEHNHQTALANLWFVFLCCVTAILVLAIAAAVVGFGYLLWKWANETLLTDPEKLEGFLKQVWGVGLVSLATMAISNIKKK